MVLVQHNLTGNGHDEMSPRLQKLSVLGGGQDHLAGLYLASMSQRIPNVAKMPGESVHGSGAKTADVINPVHELDTRNNRDFGDALIRAVFDEVSVGI